MSDYYYPDSVAEFQDYGNDWDSDPFDDLKYTDNPVDLIDDLKEEDFIMDKEINQELYELGFIGKKDFVVTDLKDKIKIYEAEINKLVNILQADLKLDNRMYENKDYAPADIINLSDYLNTLEWHLSACRDRLVGISHDVQKDIEEQAYKKIKGESNE